MSARIIEFDPDGDNCGSCRHEWFDDNGKRGCDVEGGHLSISDSRSDVCLQGEAEYQKLKVAEAGLAALRGALGKIEFHEIQGKLVWHVTQAEKRGDVESYKWLREQIHLIDELRSLLPSDGEPAAPVRTAEDRLENIVFGLAINDDRPEEEIRAELEADGIDMDASSKRILANLKQDIEAAKRSHPAYEMGVKDGKESMQATVLDYLMSEHERYSAMSRKSSDVQAQHANVMALVHARILTDDHIAEPSKEGDPINFSSWSAFFDDWEHDGEKWVCLSGREYVMRDGAPVPVIEPSKEGKEK